MRGNAWNAWNIGSKIVPEDKFSKVTVRYYLLIGIPRTKDFDNSLISDATFPGRDSTMHGCRAAMLRHIRRIAFRSL